MRRVELRDQRLGRRAVRGGHDGVDALRLLWRAVRITWHSNSGRRTTPYLSPRLPFYRPVGGASQGLEVSSTYGQYDLCGFPKAASFWYRTQWLLTVKDGPDKTFPTGGKHEVRIVESWESPDR